MSETENFLRLELRAYSVCVSLRPMLCFTLLRVGGRSSVLPSVPGQMLSLFSLFYGYLFKLFFTRSGHTPVEVL